jgi:PTH1 family peptidyl-tRNA hydrolase
MIQLIVGLGNPGDEHISDRHNAGFWLCDQLGRYLNASYTKEKSFKSQIAKVTKTQQTIWLLKPQTYMNASGEAVGAVAKFYQIEPSHILVIHDELDLPPGVARLKLGGGTGGHNGLKSISAHLGTPNYWRLRIGIGHPRDTVPLGSPHQEVVNYVLKKPPQKDLSLIEDTFDKVISVFSLMTSDDPSSAMKDLHTQK